MIVSYNPDEEKLFMTINSCLAQRNIDVQIVVSDDGTENFNLIKVIEYFEKKDFHNYVVSALNTNEGTVKNVANGLKYCKGTYTKTISPGDYLYGYDCLENWVEHIERCGATVSFGECIHYCYDNGEIKPFAARANPQVTHGFYKDSWAYNYLIFDDLVTGACMLTNTEKMREYEDLITGKIVYAEDNIYRLMAFQEEKVCYFNRVTVLYEHGNGVSTNGNGVWGERLRNDWEAADRLMLSWNKNSFLAKMFKIKYYCNHGCNRVIRKIKRCLGCIVINGYASSILKRKLHPRHTISQIDSKYIDSIQLTLIKER